MRGTSERSVTVFVTHDFVIREHIMEVQSSQPLYNVPPIVVLVTFSFHEGMLHSVNRHCLVSLRCWTCGHFERYENITILFLLCDISKIVNDFDNSAPRILQYIRLFERIFGSIKPLGARTQVGLAFI